MYNNFYPIYLFIVNLFSLIKVRLIDKTSLFILKTWINTDFYKPPWKPGRFKTFIFYQIAAKIKVILFQRRSSPAVLGWVKDSKPVEVGEASRS
jgi:hypothetical protein